LQEENGDIAGRCYVSRVSSSAAENKAMSITDRGRPSRVRVGAALWELIPSRQLDNQELLSLC